MVNVAILGFGTVGSGVAEVLTKNSDSIARQTRDLIQLKYILDVRVFRTAPLRKSSSMIFPSLRTIQK